MRRRESCADRARPASIDGAMQFAEAVLFSHERLDGDFRTVIGPKFSRASYQAFRIKPPPTVETPFALFIEWMATYSSREHGIRVSVSMIISVPAGRAHFPECRDKLSATADFACNRKTERRACRSAFRVDSRGQCRCADLRQISRRSLYLRIASSRRADVRLSRPEQYVALCR